MQVRDLLRSDRPRERLLEHGAQVLSNAELLAVLLRTGRQGHGALDEAHRLLADVGGLLELARLDAAEMMARPGFGDATSPSSANHFFFN